jgi:hypothetical protein
MAVLHDDRRKDRTFAEEMIIPHHARIPCRSASAGTMEEP